MADINAHGSLITFKLLRFYNKKHISQPSSITPDAPAHDFGVWVLLFGHQSANFKACWRTTNPLNLAPEQVHLSDLPFTPTLTQDLRHISAPLLNKLKATTHPLPRVIYGLPLTSFKPRSSRPASSRGAQLTSSLSSSSSSSSSPANSSTPHSASQQSRTLYTLYDAHPNFCVGAATLIMAGIVYFCPPQSIEFDQVTTYINHLLCMGITTDTAMEHVLNQYQALMDNNAELLEPWIDTPGDLHSTPSTPECDKDDGLLAMSWE